MSVQMTGPGDLRDQRWLDEQIESIEVGVEAVVNIARNWTDGRNLARLHPGVSAADYVTSRVGTLGKAVVPVLLAESNWSNPQIAAVAGVDQSTVYRARERFASANPEYAPPPVLGADNKLYAPRVVEAVVIDTPIENLVPRGRPVSRRYPEWWREVGMWLSRARPEDAKTLTELDQRIHAAFAAIEKD